MNRSVTIGISALNEAGNIKQLVLALLEQKGDFHLDNIIVASDGSTDDTASLARSVSDPRIIVIDDGIRKGKSERQNEFCSMSESDVLIVMDADTLPANDSFVAELVKPIFEDPKIGLVSGPNSPVNPKNFIEKTLAYGVQFKTDLFESIRPDNLFLCVGADRAFSKEFYKIIKWPPGFPEDAYSYLRAIELGFQFKYQKSAKVLFRVPDNMADHLKQSRRFINSPMKLENYFPKEFVAENYKIPKTIFFSKMLKYLLKNPILGISYAFATVYPRIFKGESTMKDKWDMAVSTKTLT